MENEWIYMELHMLYMCTYIYIYIYAQRLGKIRATPGLCPGVAA